jgi:ABC-type sugar transport system ATPase subunit
MCRQLLVLDEPTSSLDEKGKVKELFQVIRSSAARECIIIVTFF